MNNINNQVPYLRTSRQFPEDLKQLTIEVNKAYIDTANVVNNRIISIYPTNNPGVTGENWSITSGKQQSFRQVFTFTSTGSITLPVSLSTAPYVSPKSCGSFTDGTNWYGCIYASNVAIAGQVSFYVTNTTIVIISGAGAPAIVKGIIDLEWLSQV